VFTYIRDTDIGCSFDNACLVLVGLQVFTYIRVGLLMCLLLLLHSIGLRPLVSIASMTTRLHSELSCAMMLSVYASV